MAFPLITEWLINNIGALIPITKVHSYERGIKFRNGKPTGVKKPGIHLYLPYIDEIFIVDTQEQTHNLLTQSMTTLDNEAVTFSSNLVFKIVDPMKSFTVVHDFESSLSSLVMMVVAAAVAANALDNLLLNRETIEKEILDTISKRSKKWGARAIEFAFTDLVRARTYRLFGDLPGH